MAKTEYEPSQADLDTRKEIKVFSEEDIELSQAEYKNDKIMKHKKTPQEISAEVKREERATEERFIQEEMRKETIKKLKERGHQFRHIE